MVSKKVYFYLFLVISTSIAIKSDAMISNKKLKEEQRKQQACSPRTNHSHCNNESSSESEEFDVSDGEGYPSQLSSFSDGDDNYLISSDSDIDIFINQNPTTTYHNHHSSSHHRPTHSRPTLSHSNSSKPHHHSSGSGSHGIFSSPKPVSHLRKQISCCPFLIAGGILGAALALVKFFEKKKHESRKDKLPRTIAQQLIMDR